MSATAQSLLPLTRQTQVASRKNLQGPCTFACSSRPLARAHSIWNTSHIHKAPSRRMVSPVTASTNEPPRGKGSGSGSFDEVDEVTQKYGLEAGLWKVFTAKDEGEKAGDGTELPEGQKKMGKGEQAKQLLKQYGSAYLITSISLAIISFGTCYFLVNAGVDVGALLEKIGITVSITNQKVGTVAIAYAAHKAASPIRFPPTVALTPIVAKALGKKSADEVDETKEK
mmetsp:Transcript_17051/g.23532  ORF Transcript_17051/g.23532 Transcript_17051/m.23532 type:complete len:227 (+) Transcript_17051:353-1033(+)|eukprot:CAMPEP_0196580472 /NCGR_PEP_ID=MMETSP1081-20130531/28697_1 /TAXON_ID=36882 /ORGANISM="Pyramimonas amylifera, Strain CCMP720" /LENGTH=226 /DNA_ID=CAMNT_0041900339 /DNA_START=345 /DNA_END=1025 /DNA_ORIENTATION=+